ncbi:hypothetical protein Tco_1080760 [Tanacetum coccineum]|uniref:Uncharacterized protein n=1 Tax=Tanacetum coccineum TaxID=301880 RepID=A0ABQ5HVN8_9ASTR
MKGYRSSLLKRISSSGFLYNFRDNNPPTTSKLDDLQATREAENCHEKAHHTFWEHPRDSRSLGITDTDLDTRSYYTVEFRVPLLNRVRDAIPPYLESYRVP